MRCILEAISLFEEDDHRVANVQTDVAAIVMCYGVTTLFNNETMPVAFIPPIELFFDLTGNIAKMTLIMILEGL